MPANNMVFIVDDDAGVRNSLAFLLRSAGYEVEVFASATAFLGAYQPGRGGCLLLDVQMKPMSGSDLQQELNRRGWRIPVIFISGHATVPLAIAAIKAGAFDLLEKPFEGEGLLDCVRRALDRGDAAHGDRVLRVQLEQHLASLTAREREVLDLVADGLPSKLIARRLGISFRTVDVHRAHLMQKLQARSPADLIRFAMIVRSDPPR